VLIVQAKDDIKIGDCLMFPEYFISYPVLRYATANDEPPKALSSDSILVVCAEPPDDVNEYEKARDSALAEYKKQRTLAAAA
jgi:hypothetical protein